jgi:DNA-binding MarR family transcriptional regulator
MKALELYQVGRWMAKVAEEAMRPRDLPVTPPGARLIMSDVYEAPGSAIGEIAARTALPQSFVSEVVATMREKGVFETNPDPADRRRTLVRVSDAIPNVIVDDFGAVLVDDRLLDAFGDVLDGPKLVETLEALAAHLRVMREDSGSGSRPL